MHASASLTTDRARRVLAERVQPSIHSRVVPLRIERHDLVGEPVAPAAAIAASYAPASVGDPWGPAWATTWLRLTGTVPAEWAGRRVEALIDLGFDVNMTGFQCEGLVYRPDATPVKGLNPRNQWVLVRDAASGEDPVELYVEAAANPVLLDYHPFLPTEDGDLRTASTHPLYVLRRADLAIVEPEVYELALDLDVLLELQAELPEGPRRARILQALDDALDDLDLQDISGTAARARARLRPVLTSPADASAHTVSAVGHAHIDSAWLWPVRETIRKVARSASSMTALIDETDDFVFGMSSAQQYAWLKEHRPEVWARVRAAVASGRFLPLGGMWVESDTVMPTGESLVRQFLHGQRFFERELGLRCRGVWLPDSFGYSPALPQLIRRAGFEWFFTQKISWNQVNAFPHHTFEWEGIDGSRVLTHFPPMDTYNAELSGSELARAGRQFRENRALGESIAPVGWGDGGGGTTREMVGRAARVANLEGSARVRWDHPDAFFDRVRAAGTDLPVWVGELYLELHRATLTSQHRTKRGNRRCEHRLVEAELWATTATVRVGAHYPAAALDRLWEEVLLLQFHDILPGTSIAWVHREAVEAYDRIEAAAEEVIDAALAVLTAPTTPVETPGTGSRALVANGSFVTRAGVSAGAIGPAAEPLAPTRLDPRADGGWVLTNDLVRVVVDPAGLVLSAIDLETGRDAVPAGRPGNLLQVHQDFPNMWDAWDVDSFYANRVRDLREVTDSAASVVEGVARVVLTRPISTRSTAVQTLSLAPGSRTLVIDQVTDWQESETFLKVAFPLDVWASTVAAETQFGWYERVTHTNTTWEAAKFEQSMHRFVLAQEPGFGVALVTDSTYGYDVRRDVVDGRVGVTLRLSLLRAPRFPDPQADQGRHEHRFGLVIGADTQRATEAGIAANVPVRLVGAAAPVRPLVTVVGAGVVVSSVKLAADGNGDLVVRAYESLGRRATVTMLLQLPVAEVVEASLLEDPVGEPLPRVDADPTETPDTAATAVDLSFTPFEVRTLRVRRPAGRRPGRAMTG